MGVTTHPHDLHSTPSYAKLCLLLTLVSCHILMFFLAKPIQVQSFFLQASLGRSSKGGKLSGSQIKLVNQVNLLNCGAQDQEKFGVKLSMRGGCPGRLAQ